MAAGGTPSNISLGPGRLYIAPIGTTEPASGSATLAVDWLALGYTEEGTEFTFSTTREGIMVAEELDPILYSPTERTSKLVVALAEMTRRNLLLALGWGPSGTNNAAAVEPPNDDEMTKFMLVWDKLDTPSASNPRWLWRQCQIGGDVAVGLRKAPDKSTLPIEVMVEKPDSARSFKCFPTSTGKVF